jgi:glycosyltransferase 2 family protein
VNDKHSDHNTAVATNDGAAIGSDAGGRRRWWRPVKQVLRLLILALVTWGIWKTVRRAQGELAQHEFAWDQVDLRWLCLAAALYVAGLVPCWIFWHRTLCAMGQRPRWRESLRAHWIGHLGKYIPGKAMVVVLRTGLVYSDRVSRTVAATSVFIETLTMMAVGAFVAAVCLLWTSERGSLTWVALAMMVGSGSPTIPPVFRRVVRMLQVHRANPQIDEALAGVDYRLMAFGWLIIGVGWVAMGLSLWATLEAMPGAALSLRTLPLLTATVGLAMVAGFISLIPGGLGVRDWLLMTLLAPTCGPTVALVSAVLLRVVWLLSEVVISAILYVDVLYARRRTQ